MFQKSVGLESGAGWCGGFLCFCHNKADIPNPRSGVVANWFKTNVVYKKTDKPIYEFVPKPGQVAGEVSGSRISHGSIIIEEYDRDHWVTVGGNETNSVKKSIKHKRDIWIVSDYIEPIRK
jgi:hypothetical protein